MTNDQPHGSTAFQGLLSLKRHGQAAYTHKEFILTVPAYGTTL